VTVTATAPASTITVIQTAVSTTTLTQTTTASNNNPAGYGSSTTSGAPTGLATNCAAPASNFHVIVAGTNEYLTSEYGGAMPNQSSNEALTTTNGVANAVSFSPSNNGLGQVTIAGAGGITLYSDQDQFNSGAEPIYFDSLANYQSNAYEPVQFCLNADNTFTVQNQSGASGLANVVQVCSDGLVYLFDAQTATQNTCSTVTLALGQ